MLFFGWSLVAALELELLLLMARFHISFIGVVDWLFAAFPDVALSSLEELFKNPFG